MNKSFISNKIRTSSVFRLFLALIIVANLMPVFSLHAQSPAPTNGASADYTVLAPLPCIEGNGITCPAGNGNLATKVSFKTYIQYAFNLLIALAAVAAVLMIVVGGFEYMTSVSVDGKSGGIKRVQNALIGLLLVLSSYLILRTVDPRLVEIPTTLVPQITLRPELIAEVTLQQQLEKAANEYGLRREQIGELLQQTSKDITAAQKKLSDIQYEIAKYDDSSPIKDPLNPLPDKTSPAYSSLLLEEAKAKESLKKVQVNYQKQLVQQGMNVSLANSNNDAQLMIAQKDSVSAAEAIKAFTKNDAYIDAAGQTATKRLQELGEADVSQVKNYQIAAKVESGMDKINIMMGAAQVTFLPNGFGGVSSRKSIEIVNTSGKIEILPTKDAKTLVQKEIDKVSEIAKTLPENPENAASKANLLAKIKATQDKLDASDLFNK